jgi:hypothetical protein
MGGRYGREFYCIYCVALLIGATVPSFAEEDPKQTFTCTAKTPLKIFTCYFQPKEPGLRKNRPDCNDRNRNTRRNELCAATNSQRWALRGFHECTDAEIMLVWKGAEPFGGECAVPQPNLWGIPWRNYSRYQWASPLLGGIWAFIALGPLGGFALVWVGFIAAGCFFAAGGDIKALSKTIVVMIYGAIVAWIALLIIAKVPVPGLGTVWPAIVVGVTVFFLVIVASTDLLSCVPANVYGYAALVGTRCRPASSMPLRPQTTPIRYSSS